MRKNSHGFGWFIDLEKGEKGSFEKFFKDQQKFTSNLHTFGEIGIVLAKKKIKSKLVDRGSAALFVGYAENHAGDVFKMFNLKTFKVTLTRNLRFLGNIMANTSN